MSTVGKLLTAAERAAQGRCHVCGAEPVRRFAVTVDGEELRAKALLCSEHGDAFLLRVGHALGALAADEGGL
jgi:hypothetical protein